MTQDTQRGRRSMNKRDAPILFRPHGPVPGGGSICLGFCWNASFTSWRYNSASNCYVQRMSFQISLVERRASLVHWLSSDGILFKNVDLIFFTSWSSDYRIWLIPTDFVARLSRSTSFRILCREPKRAEASRISSILAFDTLLAIVFRNPLSAFKGRQEIISTQRKIEAAAMWNWYKSSTAMRHCNAQTAPKQTSLLIFSGTLNCSGYHQRRTESCHFARVLQTASNRVSKVGGRSQVERKQRPGDGEQFLSTSTIDWCLSMRYLGRIREGGLTYFRL